MLELAARSAQVLIALAGAYVVAFWFVLVVWTFRDIESRSRSVVTQVFSTLLVVLFFVPGVLLYLILRPKETLDEAFQRSLEEEYLLQDLEELPLCQSCHRYVEDDFVLCPHCHSQLREPCVSCSRLVDLRWALCPYCGTVQDGRTDVVERVEAPAGRWLAPGVRRRRAAPIGEPGDTGGPVIPVTPATPAGVERPAAAASVAADGNGDAGETRTLPFTLLSGMRSIVRPFDQHRGRNGTAEDSGLGKAATAATDAKVANGVTPPPPGRDLDGDGSVWNGTATNGHGGNGHRPRAAAANDGPVRGRSTGLAPEERALNPLVDASDENGATVEMPAKRG